MSNLERFYPEVKFGGFSDINGTVAFYNRVNSLLDPSFVVIDVGCGRGAYKDDPVPLRKNLRILKGKVTKVIGLDADPSAESNPFIDEFCLIDGQTWPVESNSVNMIVSDNVLEHISEPDLLFAEIRRVLKNGGFLCIRTPNRWSYISLAATLIPERYHSRVLSKAQPTRREEDVFPTVYRCNSIRKLRRIMKAYGFENVVYCHESDPAYLAFSTFAYLCGVVHQKFAPGFIKPVIFAFGKIKKDKL